MATGPGLDKDAVYWIEDPEGRFIPEIAGDVEYREATRELCYYDTQRPHVMQAEFKGGDPARGLSFEGPMRKAIVRKLDVATFERVFRGLTHGAPKFSHDAELQDFYRDLIRSS
ncbi:MAG: hypothetical protein WBV82_11285 [Myxococcaceae bacterium]